MINRLIAPRPVPIDRLIHKLRNPLGALQLLADELLCPSDPGEISALALRVAIEARRMNQMLSAAVLADQAARRKSLPVDIDAVVAHAIASASADLRDCPRPIVHVLAKPRVLGDAPLLIAMIEQLVRNALEADSNIVEITIDQHEGDAVIEVRDRGQGLPEKIETDTCLPFSSTKPGHLGLGLPIAARIASVHDGRLQIESLTDGGTLARVSIPISGQKLQRQEYLQ